MLCSIILLYIVATPFALDQRTSREAVSLWEAPRGVCFYPMSYVMRCMRLPGPPSAHCRGTPRSWHGEATMVNLPYMIVKLLDIFRGTGQGGDHGEKIKCRITVVVIVKPGDAVRIQWLIEDMKGP